MLQSYFDVDLAHHEEHFSSNCFCSVLSSAVFPLSVLRLRTARNGRGKTPLGRGKSLIVTEEDEHDFLIDLDMHSSPFEEDEDENWDSYLKTTTLTTVTFKRSFGSRIASVRHQRTPRNLACM